MSSMQSVLKFVQIKIAPKLSQRDQHINYRLDMNLGAVESCPLLNDYKQRLLWSRFPQSVLGGFRFRGIAPSALMGQSLLFSLPVILATISTFANYYFSLSFLLLNGILGMILFFALAAIKMLPLPKTVEVSKDKPVHRFTLEEESKMSAHHFLTWTNFKFLFPRNGHYAYRIFDPFLYAVSFALGCEVSRRSYMNTVLQLSNEVYIAIYILMWFSYSVGLYPLISNSPAEVATYKGHDTATTNHLYRTFYLLGLSATIFLVLVWYGDIPSPQPRVMKFEQKQTVLTLYAFLCLLPILFSTGWLPTLDCLVFWLPETWLTVFCGTSPSASLIGTLLQFGVTSIFIAVIHNVPRNYNLLVSVVSALLSCDVLALHLGIYKSTKFWTAVIFSFFISLTTSCIASFTDIQVHVLEYIVMVVAVTSYIFILMQKVFCFNLTRNPLYCTKKKGFKLANLVNLVKLSVCPVVLSLYYSLLVKRYNEYSWFQTVLLCRAFREIWQRNTHCLATSVLYIITRLSTDSSHLPNTDPVTCLWLCSTFLSFLFKGLRRLHFCFKLQVDFILLKKQRRKETALITLLNTIFSPVLICVAMVTAGFNIPLLPLFTLPMFCISFPRPTTFWPEGTQSFSSGKDAAFYKQITPLYLETLSRAPHQLQSGSFFLSRVENLLILTHVLESGFGYAALVVKGLELQETSCHTEEVNVVNEIFEEAFSSSKCINNFFTHMLEPVSETEIVTYSDAKNVLTGILDSPACLERISVNLRRSLTYFLCSRYPPCRGTVQFTEIGGGLLEGPSRGGFDFTALINRASDPARCPPTAVEDAGSATSYASKNGSDDFLDNLSFNGSEDNNSESWFDQVLSNKAAMEINADSREVKGIMSDDSQEKRASVGKSGGSVRAKKSCVDEERGGSVRDKKSSVGEEIGGCVPDKWLKLPFSKSEVELEAVNFPDLFFRFFNLQRGEQDGAEAAHTDAAHTEAAHTEAAHTDAAYTDAAHTEAVRTEAVKMLVSSLHLALQHSSSGVNKSANQVVKSYNSGNMHFGKGRQWIEENSGLKSLLVKSYRFAVKLSIDETIFGALDTPEEFFDAISELERDWYIGLESDVGWQESVEEGRKFVFSLGLNEEGLYSSRTLSLTKLPLYTGQLNAQAVRAIWSNLNLELYYLTNDDEERYSIQAHPNILRNIVTQAADPPLGYPVFSSGVQHISTLPLLHC